LPYELSGRQSPETVTSKLAGLPPQEKREQVGDHVATVTTMYPKMGMTYWLEKAEAESPKMP
jgi:hypothetical protein